MSEADAEQTIDIQGITQRLPHRFPFLLIDRVIEWTRGERLVAVKNVTINEWFFQGHFPGEPVMPGVLILEAMAQAGGILVGDARGADHQTLVFLANIRNARFRRPVRPGDQLHLEILGVSVRSVAPRVTATATVGKTVVAEAEIMFAFSRVKA